MQDVEKLYADVILPLKFDGRSTYLVPDALRDFIREGSRVRVNFSNREYIAVVSSIGNKSVEYAGEIKVLISLEDLPRVTDKELELWRWISGYYMCSPGEVYKASGPGTESFSQKKNRDKIRTSAKKRPKNTPLLSDYQLITYVSIKELFLQKKSVLLNTSSYCGKTGVFIRLVSDCLAEGRNVLFMVPEIASGDRISKMLKQYFPENLLVYHSGKSKGERARIHRLVRENKTPFILLGTRSSIFLPFESLSLVIVDDEHDPSYKQTDPSPRYNGRDCAIILAGLFNANVILGSGTPSLESLYNTISGRYKMVGIKEKDSPEDSVKIEIIDTIREKNRKKLSGEFSDNLISQIRECTERGEQAMVFTNRRAYSSSVHCIYCGHIPFCPKCNVPFSFHKSAGELKCHYCGFSVRFNTICTGCGKPGMKERGAGTEKIEESLKREIPQARVLRLDQDSASGKIKEEKILGEFREHKADILVGTKMLSKGSDFGNLSLICMIRAESLLSVQDFRAYERALQVIEQLSGLISNPSEGKIVIQTSRSKDPFFTNLALIPPDQRVMAILNDLLQERKSYDYPPFTRLIRITLRSKERNKLDKVSAMISEKAPEWNVLEFSGPFAPLSEGLRGVFHLQFWIRLKRDSTISRRKQEIYKDLRDCARRGSSSVRISVDVDPN